MGVLLYGKNNGGATRKYSEAIERQVPGGVLEVFDSIEELTRRLQRFTGSSTVAVFLADTREELSALFLIRKLLDGVRLILILPDHSEATVAIGHRFHPRFLSFTDNGIREVPAVLGKMLGDSPEPTMHQNNLQN
jgi:hypothetical protein